MSRMIICFKKLNRQHGDLTVSQGKRHEYLGMTLDYSNKGKVIVDMTKYTKETHKIFSEDFTRQVNTPTGDHLFDVRDNVDKLMEKERQIFHTIV